MNIQIGSKVRSFDFDNRDLEGEDACYVEGEVVDIHDWYGCDRYVILVERQIFRGKDADYHVGKEVNPPVNGVQKLLGGVYNGVELL